MPSLVGSLICTASFFTQIAFSIPCSPCSRATICNGHAELCSRKYSAITFAGAHDSPFVGELPTQNQNIDLTDQLNLGIRFLQGQTHKSIPDDKVLELCHTSCIEEDGGKLTDYLKTVTTWLDGHPNQVVTLLLTNGDNVDISLFDNAFNTAGAKKYTYAPANGEAVALKLDSWPTLGDMIDSGKRLVVFLDYGANTAKVPYILDEFAYYYETPFDTTDAKFPECTIDRPSGASADGRMGIINHFLDIDVLGIDIPNRDAAATTNSKNSIGAQAGLCKSAYGRNPNVALLDYADQGQAVAAQDSLNGL
ncbi:MAG: hypothetical protein Q9227_008538 [Pyrenula ochraceoflavens]